ncbi:TPA: hypothetical protein RG501_RS06230 [Providencia rettgeri]|nr:hypothetical protein [Providencia rettgeri]
MSTNNHMAVDIILKVDSLLSAALNLNDEADTSLRIETLIEPMSYLILN